MKLHHVFLIADEAKSIGELCSGGRLLGEQVTAAIFGTADLGKTAISHGADTVYVCPADGMIEDFAQAIASEIKAQAPGLVLLSASIRGRLMAGKIAAYLDTAVTANVSSVIADNGVSTVRMVYGGAAVRTERLTAAVPVVTLGAGVFPANESDPARTGNILELPEPTQRSIKRLEKQEKKEAAVNLATARCIVDMGRGFAAEEDLELGRKLAAVLGGDVGCSRPVAESNGWMPRARYIGVTGVIVKPELCIAIGVSGQVQHLVGINQSKTVVAINKDKNAAIFKHADFGVAGDMYKILPALIERLA